jgi:outer membrane protein OmpA-like peptidoglycan-associated protein
MNARYIPIVAFVVWSLICWRWYVCGIKEVCAPTVEATTAIEAQPVPPAADPVVEPGDAQPQKTSPNTGAPASANHTQSALTESIDHAQVVAVADRVLIHFPYGSARREDDDEIDAYLSELAQALHSTDGYVTLIGHADGIGDSKFNSTMALQRTQHIKNILVKKGVAAAHIRCKSMGESKPLATNDNPQGRYKNRRVEVRIGKK